VSLESFGLAGTVQVLEHGLARQDDHPASRD
jgi:hypothetical protein